MRKLVAGLAITLDGVIDGPYHWARQDQAMNDVLAASMAECDAILIGRNTYQEYVQIWPNMDSNLMSDFMNNTQKYVLSSTLQAPLEWANSELVSGDLADVVGRLRDQPGKNIQIPGSPALVRSLLLRGLLDELDLMVHPIVLGSSARLFHEGDQLDLELANTRMFSTGVIHSAYRPATAPPPDYPA
ncbi:MAG TPA: dihydrofolate reductase family protein [Jatrophihabitans sp.]|jgi:dihydrofolate reductase|nr:dihydrofolate reductase family protein [Jatrophihabitans sp.]